MNLLEFSTTIKKIEIIVKLHYHTLTDGEIMKQDKIYGIIKKEFDFDRTYQENADHIRKALKPYCYEAWVIPPKKECLYYFSAWSRG